jgi:hypothetical protein
MLIGYVLDLIINFAVLSITGSPLPFEIELIKAGLEMGLEHLGKRD